LELALDDVYSGYVIPAYKIAVDRAEAAAAARREAEAQRVAEKIRALEDELERLRRQSS
jgi:hypothetical protein